MNKQILLIDDDSEEQDIFKEAVNAARLSVKCFFANSAKQGMELLKTMMPDFIFLDLNMPGMNGLQCLQEIKKQEVYKQISVIMYSTAVDDIFTNVATALGASRCIKKTTSVKALTDTLKNVLLA